MGMILESKIRYRTRETHIAKAFNGGYERIVMIIDKNPIATKSIIDI